MDEEIYGSDCEASAPEFRRNFDTHFVSATSFSRSAKNEVEVHTSGRGDKVTGAYVPDVNVNDSGGRRGEVKNIALKKFVTTHTKITHACARCCSSHVRCSGGEPCSRCERKHATCVYKPVRRRRGPKRFLDRTENLTTFELQVLRTLTRIPIIAAGEPKLRVSPQVKPSFTNHPVGGEPKE